MLAHPLRPPLIPRSVQMPCRLAHRVHRPSLVRTDALPAPEEMTQHKVEEETDLILKHPNLIVAT